MAVSEKPVIRAAAPPTQRPLLPFAAPARRRRRLHVAALLAAALYGGAAYAAFVLASPLWREEAAGGVAGAAAAAARPAQPALASGTTDLLAMRTLAARARQGVYAVEAGSATGSGFVAWVQAGKERSFVLTAYAVVDGVLADGGREVFLEQGGEVWEARVVRVDRGAGLALLRVPAVLDEPLWQRRAHRATPGAGEPAFVVPAGRQAPFGEGEIAVRPDGAYELRTGAGDLNLGAPVVAGDGRLAGVVVRSSPTGVNRVAPVERACAKIRRCA